MAQTLSIIVLSDVSANPAEQDFSQELLTEDWKTERNVMTALTALGHAPRLVCVYNSVQPLLDAVQAQRPDLIFNLAEQFNNNPSFEKNLAALLELLGIPFTGTSSAGLTLCKDKWVTQTLLSYHRIRVPKFAIIHRGQKICRPARLTYPLFVKGLSIEGSVGIAKSSFVTNDAELKERVEFIHTRISQAALVEQFVDGREFYVSILGNHRLQVFPLRELTFGELPPDEPKIATYKVKWDEDYRKRWKIRYQAARNLPDGAEDTIRRLCKRAYRLLQLRGYARFDIRLRDDGQVYILEANPNPFLANDEDFAESAAKAGLTYDTLIERIVGLALS